MFFHDGRGRAVEERAPFQFGLDHARVAFDSCDFLVQPFPFSCPVPGGYGQKDLAQGRDRHRSAGRRLVIWLQRHFFGVQ